MGWGTGDEFEDALDWFRARVPMTEEQYAQLTAEARRKAFRVAGVADLDVVDQVHKEIGYAIQDGTTLSDFKKSVRDRLGKAWSGQGVDVAARIENIFRTNVQLAYGAGRYKQLTDPAVLKYRPFWLFDWTNDLRTSKVCKSIAAALDGKALPADDPFWPTHSPPLHFRCRSGIRSLRRSQAEKRGIAEKAPDVEPSKGFGKAPGAEEWKPDLTKYTPELANAYKEKEEARIKASYDPSLWLETYKHLGDAALTAAHGRAAEELGMQLKADDVLKMLEADTSPEWMRLLGAHVRNLVEGVRSDPVEPRAIETLQELEADLKRTLDDYNVKHVRVAGALGGHIQSLGERIGANQVPRLDVSLRGASQEARKRIDEAERTMRALLSEKRSPANPKLKLSGRIRRGHYIHRDNQIMTPKLPRLGLIEHEWGHALEEANRTMLKLSVEFLNRRTPGEKDQYLSVLAGSEGYGSHEVARPDKFRNPYVGKRYSVGDIWTATEVTSMGLEWLSTEPALFWKEDPEHFYFILGQLAGA